MGYHYIIISHCHIDLRVVVEAGTSETKTETWVTETKAI